MSIRKSTSTSISMSMSIITCISLSTITRVNMSKSVTPHKNPSHECGCPLVRLREGRFRKWRLVRKSPGQTLSVVYSFHIHLPRSTYPIPPVVYRVTKDPSLRSQATVRRRGGCWACAHHPPRRLPRPPSPFYTAALILLFDLLTAGLFLWLVFSMRA